jgi:hypothetical protein
MSWRIPGWVGLAISAIGITALAIILVPVLFGGGTTPLSQLGVTPPEQSRAASAASASSQTAPIAPIVTADSGTGSGAGVPPIAGQPIRLRIPSVGLDDRVGSMTVRPGSVVDPPTASSAYWLSGYGVAGPTSDNSVYIAGHTCRGRCSAAFSALLDVPQSSTTVHIGDSVIVSTPTGDYSYSITGTQLYEKVTVQQQSELWRKVPGRLVLVTCFQYNGGTSSQQNFVVYAQLNK